MFILFNPCMNDRIDFLFWHNCKGSCLLRFPWGSDEGYDYTLQLLNWEWCFFCHRMVLIRFIDCSIIESVLTQNEYPWFDSLPWLNFVTYKCNPRRRIKKVEIYSGPAFLQNLSVVCVTKDENIFSSHLRKHPWVQPLKKWNLASPLQPQVQHLYSMKTHCLDSLLQLFVNMIATP